VSAVCHFWKLETDWTKENNSRKTNVR